MRRRLLLALAVTALAVTLPAGAEVAQADTDITLVPDSTGRFTAALVTEVVTLAPDRRDAPLRLSQTLALGSSRIDRPIVVGADGQPLPSDFDRMSGKLYWRLPATEAGPVTVRFRASPAVQETVRGNRLGLDWLSRWEGPVAARTATIHFPQGFVPQNITSTWDAIEAARPVQQVAIGVQALQIDLTQGPADPLVIAFTPKLVTFATVLYALIGALFLLLAQTAMRLVRVPHLFRADLRDPTPTELALLCGSASQAMLIAHLDLELQNGLLRGGGDFETVQGDAAHEPYQQFILAYYQVPRALRGFFREGCVHYQAAVDAARLALYRKGLFRDVTERRQCGWDLLGYWAVTTAFLALIVFAMRPWGQDWVAPWLTGGGIVLLAYLAVPVAFLLQDPITPLATAKIRKYETLLAEGLHTRDEARGYRLQLVYGAAYKGIDWLEGALPADQIAVYQSVLRPTPFWADEPTVAFHSAIGG